MKLLAGLATKLSAAVAILCKGGAFAAWPHHGTTMIIVPQAASGTNDTVARIIGAELGKALRKTVIVDNWPGAAGAIGAQGSAGFTPPAL